MSTDAAPVDVAVREPDTVIVSIPVNPPTVSAAAAVPPVDEVNGGMVGNIPLFGSVNVLAKLKVFDPKLGTVSGGNGLKNELDPDGGVKLGKYAESDPPRAPWPGDRST
jgi:hypothetical protein